MITDACVKIVFLEICSEKNTRNLQLGPLKYMYSSSSTNLSICQQLFEKKYISEGILGKTD